MRVLVTLSNDLVTDQRVQKVCNSLVEWGHQPVLIGRQLPHSLPLPEWSFKAVRMKLFFRSGPLFYAELNLRLFLKLLVSSCDAIHANDLDTLLPAYLVSGGKNEANLLRILARNASGLSIVLTVDILFGYIYL
jgi:hypothetical protein